MKRPLTLHPSRPKIWLLFLRVSHKIYRSYGNTFSLTEKMSITNACMEQPHIKKGSLCSLYAKIPESLLMSPFLRI